MENDTYISTPCQMDLEDFINFPKTEDEDEDNDDDCIFDYNVEDESDVSDSLLLLSSDDEDVKPVDNLGLREVPTTFLSESEREIVDLCKDPQQADLKRMLVLNRSKKMQLVKLHKKIKDMLTDCRKNIYEVKHNAGRTTQSERSERQTWLGSGLWKVAAPYFRDKFNFGPPPNQDTIRRRANNEISSYESIYVPNQWRENECRILMEAVILSYNMSRKTAVTSRIRDLKERAETQKNEEVKRGILSKIEKLEEELEELNGEKEKECPPLGSDEKIDWIRISDKFFGDRRSDTECRNIWHHYLHPQVNKTDWTPDENERLCTLARKHNYQDWDAIAAELGNNRTAFMAGLHFLSNLCEKFKRTKFTPEEDQMLLALAEHFKVGNCVAWHKVAHYFENRSRQQLYHRYIYYLCNDHVKRGRFTDAEDILLMVLVDKFGKDFKKCAQYIPHRTQIQLKCRYNSNLQQTIKKGCFTLEDDETIYNYVELYGTKRWSGLTAILGRSRGQLRQRYHTIKTFLDSNPESQIAHMTRRKHNYDTGDTHYLYIRQIADTFRQMKVVPTLSMIEERMRVCVSRDDTTEASIVEEMTEKGYSRKRKIARFEEPSEPEPVQDESKLVDQLLTNKFCNFLRLKHNYVISPRGLSEAVENTNIVLHQLGADLDIPVDFARDSRLDNVDIEILTAIKSDPLHCANRHNYRNIDSLVPPNLSTLAGLRSLLIKHKNFKAEQHLDPDSSTRVSWQTERYLQSLDHGSRHDILKERRLFGQRFTSLLSWSSVMSSEQPKPHDLEPKLLANTAKRFEEFADQSPVVERRKEDFVLDAPLKRHCYPSRKSGKNKNVKRIKIIDVRSVKFDTDAINNAINRTSQVTAAASNVNQVSVVQASDIDVPSDAYTEENIKKNLLKCEFREFETELKPISGVIKMDIDFSP